MSDDRIREFQKKRDQLKKQVEKVDDILKIKRNNTKKEIEIISYLEKYKNKQKYIYDMYDNIPEDKMVSMNREEYASCAASLGTFCTSGETVDYIHNESKQSESLSEHHANLAGSLITTAEAESIALQHFSSEYQEWFPGSENINRNFQEEDSIHKHIDQIRDKLSSDFPYLHEDFENLISKFNLYNSSKFQYQDLIGARSLFYFKMIFEFTKAIYGRQQTRYEDISKFVYGSNPPVPAHEPLIRACKEIWDEISDQDSGGTMSVKLGEVIPSYIENVYRRLIGSIASILQIRSQYFRQ